MRAFYISVVLFVLMLLVIGGSMAMNRYVCGHMQAELEKLPDEPSPEAVEQLVSLQAFWVRWRGWMRLCVNQVVWRAVNDPMMTLVPYAALGQEATNEYVGARIQLLCAIQEMSRPERVALSSIF
ncbi:MAG: hypothetical protein E7625_00535 [Ruminococcaceae bacterium]|nr:hypothetical protein [Oscillospiraceae bacterium]